MVDIIKTKDLKKSYLLGKNNLEILHGINLKVNKGDIAMILGPSGSGKSTLLHLLGALDKPSSGQIFIKDKNLNKLDDYKLSLFRRYYLGFVFQNFNLIPTLNVLENVLIPTIPNGTKDKDINNAKDILKEIGLINRLKHKPMELSGGERQRVSIARSLINDPEIIYADEPTGNLDSKTGTKIIDLIIRLRDEKNKTFVIVTHDEDLTKYADTIYHIKDGLLIN